MQDIGTVVSEAVVTFCATHRSEILKLHEVLRISKRKEITGKFSDRSFVLTGSLSSMSRSEAKEKIEALGGKVGSSVTKTTNSVIAGDEPGSKLEKARKLSVAVWYEKQFLNELQA